MGQWICIISMPKFMTRFSSQLLPFVCSVHYVRSSVCDSVGAEPEQPSASVCLLMAAMLRLTKIITVLFFVGLSSASTATTTMLHLQLIKFVPPNNTTHFGSSPLFADDRRRNECLPSNAFAVHLDISVVHPKRTSLTLMHTAQKCQSGSHNHS